MPFLEVILPLALPRTFTYAVDEASVTADKIGCRVLVPFGKSRIYTALIVDVHNNAPVLYEAKPIHQIIDDTAVVTPLQIRHWFWIADYYMCPIGDVYRAAMPSGMILESDTVLTGISGQPSAQEGLTDDEYLVLQALEFQSSLKVAEVVSILGKKNVYPVIRSLTERRLLLLEEEVRNKYTPKQVLYVQLSDAYTGDDAMQQLMLRLKSAEKQRWAVMAYFQLSAGGKPLVKLKELTNTSGVGRPVINSLIEKGIFELYEHQEDRILFSADSEKGELILSDAQQQAYEETTVSFREKDVCLLHGVTSSGKTEIYIKLIENALASGRQVLYLLPEIALTTQLVSRLTAWFGNQVAVFHSRYSNNERVEVWRNVYDNSEGARIILGARSALFLPFAKLDLIIVDEEHEQTFKQQDPAPRYHARDAAIVLAGLHGAKVLLGSATPSLETYYNAVSGKYALVELHVRYGNMRLPSIELVDLKDKYFRKKMKGHFSDVLIEQISEKLALREQVILFQNRRGYSPVVECMDCGHVPQCSNCDVSLTFHKHKNQLRCHYCGYSIANPTHCHKCSSVHLTTKGFGTEQIQQELAELFPSARIARMDQDTTRGKFAFERLIEGFRNRESDILVGTQMLAKGLDFDNVTLVGIMNADSMLYYPDFRAFERSFQLMTQVSGRSGRAEKKGHVIIQTYNPHHNTINQITANDYKGMYAEQIYERQIYKYPPFYRLIRISLRHRDFEKLKQGAQWLYDVLHTNLQVPVLGPEEPPIGRVRNEYIRTIMIKIPQGQSLQGTKKTIRKLLNSFESVPQFRPIKVILNVDYY